jgi:hypothetical protein
MANKTAITKLFFSKSTPLIIAISKEISCTQKDHPEKGTTSVVQINEKENKDSNSETQFHYILF